MKKIIIAACLAMNFFAARAQEILFPLSKNPVIKEFLRKNPPQDHASLRTMQSALLLPFQDDFSDNIIYPRPELWVDSDAYINQGMCYQPITIGVATLDGMNKYGEPHDSMSTAVQPVICDYLTSQPIDLSLVTPAENVYFSFFYQPQGLGEEPEEEDSLVLEFLAIDTVDSTFNWIHIWSTKGIPNAAFAPVRIKIDSAVYFWAGFQFRFYNYANPNGNRDHWNIDYVNLDKNQSATQPLYEITLVNPIKSYLHEFTAMPYSHYKYEVDNGNNPVRTDINDTIRVHEMTGATATATLNFSVNDRAGNNIFSQGNQNVNLQPNNDYSIEVPLPSALFTSTNADFTDFYISHQMSSVASGWSRNDTSYMTQHFYNYYAYDDGSAESATGVPVAYTKYAYLFDVKKSDSLIGISIYFNPWGKNVHQDLFSLCVWDNLTVGSNTDVLVHQTIDKKPANNDTINGFVDYYLDFPVPVSAGTHYFGIIQSSAREIGIGVDHNTDSHNKMFLNFYNQWQQSGITGSWMMRPMFEKRNTIGIEEIESVQFDIFPNPANESVIVETSAFSNNVNVNINNMLGEQLLTETITAGQSRKILNVSSLSPGIYFVQLSNGTHAFPGIKKLIVTR